MAGPRGRDRHAAPPPPAVRRRRQGTRGPPPTLPPPPTQVQEGTEADKRNGGPTPPSRRPLHPGCGGTTAEAGAHTPCLRPADGGLATPRTAQTERPYQRPAQGRRGREPGWGGSPPPPPAALTRRRPTGPRPTPAAARQPPRQEYTPEGHAGGNGRQADARRGGGGGGAAPHPPPRTPPKLGSHRSGPPPPRSRGDAPPPQKGPRRGGGGCGWNCSRGGRGREASPNQRAGATRAPEQYGGRAPHDPPVTTAHSGRAEGGSGLQGPPGERSTGRPSPPPTPGRHCDPDRTRTPEGSAPTTRGGPGWNTAGRHPEGEQGGRAATPPPSSEWPASRGGPGPHPPRQGGWSPPRPREEPERDSPPRPTRRLPRGPRRTSEPAPTRQEAAQIAPREGG